jgi:hypothetical protein
MTLFQSILAFFEGRTSDPAAARALADVRAAEASVLAAVEPIAEAMVNAALAQIPLVGPLLEAPADAILAAFLSKLSARFPSLTVPATMAPVANP